MKSTNIKIMAELEKIRRSDPSGLLVPEAVIEAARPSSSPLHSKFTWGDSEAAHQWRLHQARMLIRVLVHMEPNANEDVETRVFVSLSTDRGRGTGGGYRKLTAVMKNPETRAVLLDDARRDMVRFKQKYQLLEELSGVFVAMDKHLIKQCSDKAIAGKAR